MKKGKLEVASITVYDDKKMFELLDRIATALEKIAKKDSIKVSGGISTHPY
jgi:hypothetical protein